MELSEARKRADELRAIIEKNNRLYYDQDAPELEDFEYDALTRELKAIEAEYPQLVTASSPTQHVGGTASSKFSKVTHAVKMESLQDAFSLDELRDYRFYAADLVHPRDMAVDYIWEKFRLCCIPGECQAEMDRNLRLTRQAAHRPMHRAEPNG